MKKIVLIFMLVIASISILPLINLTFETSPPEGRQNLSVNSQTISVYNSETGDITEENMEEYLIGVVAAEMPALYETEALKAQAVAARSYIMTKIGKGNPDHKGADVCTSPSHCKAFTPMDKAKENWGKNFDTYYKKISTAVKETAGEYVTYQGEVAVTCFYAVSGGKTENASDVWGGDTPYLKSVESPGDLSYDNLKTSTAFSKEEASLRLGINTFEISDIILTEGGSVKTMKIGEKEFSGTEIRSIFALNSANFQIHTTDTELVFETTGKGHGVGMSQFGANQMAKQGKNYREILLHYYQGVTIEKI